MDTKFAIEAKETANEGDLATLHAMSIKADVKKYSVITRHKPLKFKDCVGWIYTVIKNHSLFIVMVV